MEKEQSKESLPYWFETEEYKQFSKLAHNNFGGKPKQETLEEAAKRLYPIKGEYFDKEFYMVRRIAFIEGAKWQQEQILQFLYSEITERRPYSSSKMCEEVIKFIEQFKKK